MSLTPHSRPWWCWLLGHDRITLSLSPDVKQALNRAIGFRWHLRDQVLGRPTILARNWVCGRQGCTHKRLALDEVLRRYVERCNEMKARGLPIPTPPPEIGFGPPRRVSPAP